jgi:hypothetical protein
MKQIFETVRRENKLNVNVPRFTETYATFVAVAEVYREYLIDSQCYSENDINMMVQSDLEAIAKIICSNDQDACQLPDEAIIAEAILNTMGAQKLYSEVVDPLERIEEDNGFVVVYPSYLHKLLDKFYRDAGRVYPFASVTELSKFMDDKNMIKVTADGKQKRYSHKYKKIYDTEKRFYLCYKTKLVEILER